MSRPHARAGASWGGARAHCRHRRRHGARVGGDRRRPREQLRERLAVVHERLREVDARQQEAVHEHGAALERPLWRQERLREQEEGRQAVSERHRDREDDPAFGSEGHAVPGRRDAQAERTLEVRRVPALGIALRPPRLFAVALPELPRAGARERLRLHERKRCTRPIARERPRRGGPVTASSAWTSCAGRSSRAP